MQSPGLQRYASISAGWTRSRRDAVELLLTDADTNRVEGAATLRSTLVGICAANYSDRRSWGEVALTGPMLSRL